jgi:LPS export ABC transporter protein LptC
MIVRLGLLAVVALGAACADRGIAPKGQAAARDTADMVIFGMDQVVTREGITTARINAESAWVHQGRQVTDMKLLTVTFYEPNGSVRSTVVSKRGTYQIGNGTLDAQDSVVATTPDGQVVRTQHLIFDKIADQIRSDSAYTFTGPRGSGSGASFVTDSRFQVFESTRTRGRQRGKGVLMSGGRQP